MHDIKIIKEEYLNPLPLLYKYKGCIENSLVSNDMNTAVDITLREAVNECATLSFTIPFTEERKIDWNSLEKLVYFQGIYFIIKEIEVDDSTMDMKISCEEVSSALKGIYCECVCQIGKSPQEIFNAIVSASKMNIGYTWLGTDITDTYRHLITEDETSIYENLMSLAEVFNATIEFSYDESGQNGYIYLRKNTIKSNKFITKSIDMKSLNITSYSNEIFTQIYATGYTDEDNITLDIQSVNNGQSILKDYSYYQSIGVPDNVILNEPMYNQLISVSDDVYTDANDLKQWAREQLDIYCKPQWTASISLSDLSVYIDSPIEVPKKMMDLKCINQDINFIFDCQITAVERNFNDPLDIQLEISNVIPYDTNVQRTGHAIDTIDKITKTDPRNTDGDTTGDGKPYIDMQDVKDGDHWNQLWVNQQFQSYATQQADLIALKVEELEKSYAQLAITANSITSTVEEYGVSISKIEQKSNSIVSTVTSLDGSMEGAKSSIEQYADKIQVKVSKGEFGSVLEQNPRSLQLTFNKMNKFFCVDDTEGMQLGDRTKNTYSKVGYDGRMAFKVSGESKPYHCLSWVGRANYCECGDSDEDYRLVETVPLPARFDTIPRDEIYAICAISKFYDSNSGSQCLAYWNGAYCYVTGSDNGSKSLKLYAIGTWRDYDFDENGMFTLTSPRGGFVDISYMVIA